MEEKLVFFEGTELFQLFMNEKNDRRLFSVDNRDGRPSSRQNLVNYSDLNR